MLLYILRHAEAEPAAASDFERELTEKGIAQASQAGRFCQEKQLFPEVILTSPLVRARQTAQHFAAAFEEAPAPDVAAFLASGMEPEAAIAELQGCANLAAVMIVGHEPDLSLLIARLMGLSNASALQVAKASLTLLDVHAWRAGGAELNFTLPCELM